MPSGAIIFDKKDTFSTMFQDISIHMKSLCEDRTLSYIMIERSSDLIMQYLEEYGIQNLQDSLNELYDLIKDAPCPVIFDLGRLSARNVTKVFSAFVSAGIFFIAKSSLRIEYRTIVIPLERQKNLIVPFNLSGIVDERLKIPGFQFDQLMRFLFDN